jgi:hypothetical protein
MAVHALVMGFGGTGAHILTYLKEMAVLKHGKKPDSIKFLLFDTIAGWEAGKTVQIVGGGGEETLAKGQEKGTSLDSASEYYYLQDSHPPLENYVFELLASGAQTAKNYTHLRNWLHTSWLGRHITKDKLNIKDGAAQQRQIGRFAMFQNVEAIISHIDRALTDLIDQAGGATIQIWIIGSAAGGTGGGTLLDAAYMTRLAAARKRGGIQVSGVIVLPDIFSDKDGISLARAYSLFRELNRFQEVGFGNQIDHRYLVGNTQYSSEVSYDNNGRQRALVESSLFDNLFYLGTQCRNDRDREAFFSSVANALDPYLDAGQGRDLLQQAINNVGFAASSFGAARLYVPQETYAELFAWDEVYKFICSITAPIIEGEQATDVYSGSKADRQEGAKSKIKSLLPLFEELLKLEGKKPEEIAIFAKNTLDPEQIVTQWYQLGGAGLVKDINLTPAELQKTVLTYTNPYFSLVEAKIEKIDNHDIAVKTYKENKAAKGPKEDQTTSRDNFAEQLVQCTQRYTSDGKGSFQEGRKIVLKALSQLLSNKIDALIQNELVQNPRIAWDNADQAQGTAMTRLYYETLWASAEGGTLDKIFQIISIFLEALDQEEGMRSSQVVSAANTLKNSSPSFFGTWVNEPQVIARAECGEYIRWYQNRELLKDMQELVKHVKKRFNQWAEAFRGIISDLTISQPDRRAALEIISTDHLKRLNDRLYRLARNPSALISCQPKLPGGGYDKTMQGYREVLRNQAVGEDDNRLAFKLLSNAHWQLRVDDKGKPQLELVAQWGDNDERTFHQGQEMSQLYQALYDFFREVIDDKLRLRDIFDYLVYAQNQKNVEPKDVAELLNDTADVLLKTPALAAVNWVYKAPAGGDKQNLAEALQTSLSRINPETGSPATLHSDRNTLTLLKVCKPAPDQVTNLNSCLNAYVAEQMDDENGDHNHDQELYRAQVYHPFRAELEAWYIERRYYHTLQPSEGFDADKQIAPRVTRLLEHPDMMQAFVRCIATKAIERDNEQQIWVFHNSAKKDKVLDIALTTSDKPTADVMSAAVTFVLRQLEAKQGSRVKITLDHAEKSAVNAAQQAGQNVNEMVEAFVGEPENSQQLDQFLDEHFNTDGLDDNMAEREKQNLKMIFQFYGDKNRRTHLGDRMQLP